MYDSSIVNILTAVIINNVDYDSSIASALTIEATVQQAVTVPC